MLHVQVNAAKCCGYGLCAEAAGQVFKIDEDGFAYVDDTHVPPGLEDKALAGANVCPESAIYVGEQPPPGGS